MGDGDVRVVSVWDMGYGDMGTWDMGTWGCEGMGYGEMGHGDTENPPPPHPTTPTAHILQRLISMAPNDPTASVGHGDEVWGRGDVGPRMSDGAVCPQCITDWHRQNGFPSSLALPDNTLNFAKKHPLMDEPVLPQRGRPLLLKKDSNFTQLAVDRVAGLDGAVYEVLFVGTGTASGVRSGAPGWGAALAACPALQVTAGCTRR